MTSYKTPAAQTFTEALGKYLGGREWQENVMIFVKSNCDKFYEVEDYDHEHHALWKTYQDICESILRMALESAGGSIESLEKALDEVASIPSKGPKEEVVKDILERLMAFEDFESFSKMMEQAATEEDFSNNEHDVPTYAGTAQLGSPGGSPSDGGNTDRGMGAGVSEDTLNQLLAFGFEQDLIDLVVAGSPADTGLEQLVMTLSGMQAGGDSSPGYKSQKKGGKQPSAAAPSSPAHTRSEDKESTPTADNMSSPPADRGGGRRKWPSHLEQFAKEGELGDVSELHAKFVMARSLLDTFIDGDVSPGVVLLVQWASDMVELHAEVEMAHARKQSMTEPCDKRPDTDSGGLVGWYNELEETRRVADESQVAGNMLSDTEVARMAELDRIAGTGTEDEQLLHAMISRHDEVQKTINNLHQRCGAMCGPGTGMSRQTLEELYLFLKEKVNEAPGSGADGEEVDLSQVADELHEHVYSKVDSAHGRDVINILLEMHVMEDEQALLRQKIDSILGSPSRGADAKEGRSSPHFFAEEEGKDGDGDSKAAEAKESKEEADAEAAAQRVSALKNKHKDSLRTLKDSLDAEKDKKLSALESRLMRRRRAKEKELAALKKEGGSTEDEKSLRETMEAAEAEIQKEIDDNTASFDKLKESIMGGFKKACIYEINATKAKGAALSKEEEEEAHKEAAEALKKRYLRDRKALSESLEADRLRRRKMMMVQLMKKKKALGGDSQAITQAEAEAAEAIAEMELDFDKQQRISLAEPEEHVLLGLAGIFSDVASLKKKNTDDDDDDFFDEDEEGGDHTNKKWLENVLRSRDAFMLAGQSLQDKLHSAGLTPEQIEKILRQMEESPDGELTSEWLENQGIGAEGDDPVGEHMLKVLTDAFTKQIGGANRSSATAGLFDAEKARAGIMDEFKRSKGAYDEALAHAHQQSKDAIARRRAKKRGGGGGGGGGMGADAKDASDDIDGELRFTRSTNDYENAVDAFLEDGLMFGGNAGASRVQNPSFASLVKDFDGYKHRGPKPTRVTKAPRGAEEKGESPSDSIAQSAKKDKQAREAKEEAENREELSSIRTKAADKEGDLIAALELEMQRKKAALKLRISKRKAKNEDDAFGAEAEDDGAADEDEQLKDIEAAFDKAVGLLKKTEESRLNGVNVGQLIDVMNRFANKAESKREALKRANSGGTSSSSPLPPISARAEVKESSSFEEVEDFMSDLGLNAPEPMALTHVERQVEQRRNMAAKAEKIADTFNEENQKLDLMMRIQQARQKQSLQRKLLARKSGLDISSSSGGGNIRGGAGFSSSGSNQLPARGLDNSVTREEAMRSPTGPNENRQQAMNASSRGMDMTRLLRK